MSYYINTYEVPVELLEKLKTLAPDYDRQMDVFYAWRQTIPQVEATNVMEAPFRAYCGGKVSMDFQPDEQEIRFWQLVNQDVPSRDRRYLSEGYPGISDYQDPEEVAITWKRIEQIIAGHPEYAVLDLLAADTFMEILAAGSPLDEFVRFYYGCAMRGSATITIDS